ncbi:MAG TPA: DUF427 domain-containing protein [Nocardioidaceae bacterium]|nr:DUF427 domain-containing protein [Nocardioidaceae bacterium]
MSEHARSVVDDLAFEPAPFRVRGYAAGRRFVDSRSALLVWEPRRVVPVYAVPLADLDAELVPLSNPQDPEQSGLSPHAFQKHSSSGSAWDLRVDGDVYEAAAFRPDDADLAEHVLLDLVPFTWKEEEEEVFGHPHDPFKRIDIRRSARHVVVSHDGTVLADTHAPLILAETLLPLRWYLPRSDVRMDLLSRSDSRTTCAYKGHAAYYSLDDAGDEGRDLAWTYEQPLHDAEAVRDHICFWNERTDITVDDVRVPRPGTPAPFFG